MNNPLQHTKPANRNHILPPTAAYALVQGTFWMTFCTYQTFAAAYLQDLGFSNTELGIVLAAGNLLSVLLAGALSTCIDRDARVTAARVIPVLFVLQAATQLYLVLFAGKGALTAIAFVVLITFANSVNAMNIKLYVDLTHGGVQVDFGIARGFGSFVYVLLCTALGVLTGLFSTRLYPLAGLVLTGLQILAHVLICSRLPEGGAAHEHAEADTKQGLPMARFLAENGRYCALLAGVVLLFFAHNMIVNFMINIVGSLGGDATDMGYVNAFMAATEIPVMVLFARLFGKRDMRRILCVTVIAFTLKDLAIALASNIPMLYAAHLLQAPSYALYMVAIVPYVDHTIAHADAAKAQSLAISMTTAGSIFAGLFGGMLFDHLSVFRTLLVVVAISAAGTVTALAGLQEKTQNDR